MKRFAAVGAVMLVPALLVAGGQWRRGAAHAPVVQKALVPLSANEQLEARNKADRARQEAERERQSAERKEERERAHREACALRIVADVDVRGRRRVMQEEAGAAPSRGGDACLVTNDNIALAVRQSATQAAQPPMPRSESVELGQVQYFDKVREHLGLTRDEIAKLKANNMVVLDRVAYDNYAVAFHDVFQQQLPVFVGIDPILHALSVRTELNLATVERKTLKPALKRMLSKLRAGLRTQPMAKEQRDDLEVYLGVAAAFAAEGPKDSPYIDKDADFCAALSPHGHGEEICLLMAGEGLSGIEIFGRSRMVDFTQLEPRGHYAFTHGEEVSLSNYFRAVMWLSRLEFNLASRGGASSHPDGSREETPREARDAMALAELVQSSGASAELALFEETYTAYAGAREDVSMLTLRELMKEARVSPSNPEGPAALRVAIGTGFKRTARTHFTWEGTGDELPVIATLLGPRVVPDVAPLTHLVHDTIGGRFELGFADVGSVMGHDGAAKYLAKDVNAFPTLAPQLALGRTQLREQAMAHNHVYGSWLRSLLAIAETPRGMRPAYMQGEAYKDMNLNSALVGYAQLKHAFVLLAAQGYDAYGCEIPDGHVEPLLPVWDAMLEHAKKIGWAGGVTVIAQLRDIAADELAGRPLKEAQRRWLGMVSEVTGLGCAGDSCAPPEWTGWYYDLYSDGHIGAEKSTALVADYFTLTNLSEVKYLGADGPRLGVFLVDTGGARRVMVGPVARGYELTGSLSETRFNDETAREATGKTAPWRESFAAPAVPEPLVGLHAEGLECEGDMSDAFSARRYVLRSEVPLQGVSMDLRDHHGDVVARSPGVAVGSEGVAVRFLFSAEDKEDQQRDTPVFGFGQTSTVHDWIAGAEVQFGWLHIADLSAVGLPGQSYSKDAWSVGVMRADPVSKSERSKTAEPAMWLDGVEAVEDVVHQLVQSLEGIGESPRR